jgi:N-acetylmuramoyl-L-alanine amidase
MGIRARLFAAAALALAASIAPARAGSEEPPIAVAAHLTDDGETARLTFDLSGPVEARAQALVDPDRIVLDFPEVDFHIDPAAGHIASPRAGALIKAFRFGLFGPGKSRVVIELGRAACVSKLETRPIADGEDASRLGVELEPCSTAAFAAAAKASAPAPAPAAAKSTPPASTAGPPVIVLDPGHGGVDGGAFGLHGTVEKTIVYDFALELKRKLEAENRFKVVMTRDGDQYVSLEDRVRIARDAGAALLISIHADAIAAAAEVTGTTVYTCSERASDAFAARIAARENSADKAAGVEGKAEAAGVADILFDLKRRETRAYAHLFSRGLVSQWRGVGPLNHNPERSAGFVVLKAPDFPSVLVELGYLSNALDVANMTSPEWRDKASTAMATAVTRFFAPADGAAPALAASTGKGADAK